MGFALHLDMIGKGVNGLKRLVAAFCCALLLSACTPVFLSTNDLIRPPKLSETQAQVEEALLSALGIGRAGITLKYPRSGEYRSAFMFFDIDNNGQDEALVFYSINGSDEAARINILSKTEQGWVSVYDLPGIGQEIESVSFASLTQADHLDMVIGWENGGDPLLTLSVMRFDGEKLRTLFTGSYTGYAIANLDNDPLEELVLVAIPGSSSPYAQLVKPDLNRLDVVSGVALNQDFVSIEQLKVGNLSASVRGIVVDGLLDSKTLSTEVITVTNGQLALPLEVAPDYYDLTHRDAGGVLSLDVNKDGILELPTQQPAPGYEDVKKPDSLQLTQYRQITPAGFETVVTCFVNSSAGYRFTLPSRWVGSVSLSVQASTGEVKFFRFTGTLEDQSGELLRIRVYSLKDYQDKFDTEKYTQIGRKGNFVYYAYLHRENAGDLALKKQELEELFTLL